MGGVGSGITEAKVRAMARTAATIDINSREGEQFRNSVRNAMNKTDDPKLLKTLNKIWKDIN